MHDGIVAERAPHLQLAGSAICSTCGRCSPRPSVRRPRKPLAAIDRMAPTLRFFRYGDGGLALFNGAWEGAAQLHRPGACARSGLARTHP